ncbi:MAG: DUF305 domain-containing protein [Candidatus Paceibacterota bacterium]|jgi:uncharacterized protein (DUF305 family)
MNNKILLVIVGVAIGILGVLLATSAAQPGSMMSGWGYGQRIVGTGQIDRHFIEQMIPHHDGAIAMASLALTKSNRSEIKILVGSIIEAQTEEIQDMRGWYENWFGKSVPEGTTAMMGGGMMSGGGMHMGGREDMAALENASDFDRTFIEQMIPHHQLAIMMAQMLKSGTNRPEMLSLADNIIESQSREIREMQGWYEKWY